MSSKRLSLGPYFEPLQAPLHTASLSTLFADFPSARLILTSPTSISTPCRPKQRSLLSRLLTEIFFPNRSTFFVSSFCGNEVFSTQPGAFFFLSTTPYVYLCPYCRYFASHPTLFLLLFFFLRDMWCSKSSGLRPLLNF